MRCEFCSTEFAKRSRGSRDANRFCSLKCAGAFRTHRRKVVPFCRISFQPCGYCGRVFLARWARKYCSRQCSDRQAWERKRARAGRVKVTQGVCRMCDAPFANAYGEKRRAFCSRDCSQKFSDKATKKRRRARYGQNGRMRATKFGVAYQRVDRIAVFERAGWRCALCLCDTPRELLGTTAANAPELDHIVPLSRGGAHAPDNVQLACRRCNGLKGARLWHEIPWTQNGKVGWEFADVSQPRS